MKYTRLATCGLMLHVLAAVACGSSNASSDSGSDLAARGGASAGGSGGGNEIPRKPNIVLLLLDDLDSVVSGEFLDDVLPETMALVRQGVTFDNAFVPTSICCPSRAALLSGRCGHNTNVLTNGGPFGGWTQFRDEDGSASENVGAQTLPAWLSEVGYESALFGKYLNGYHGRAAAGVLPPVPVGWSDWHAFADEGSAEIKAYTGYGYSIAHSEGGGPVSLEKRGREDSDYVTDVLRENVLSFIKRRDKDRPFFAYIAPTAPHAPLPPAPRHEQKAKTWRCDSMPKAEKRRNFFSDGASFEDKPSWLRDSLTERDTVGARTFNCADWKRRLGSLYAIDELVKAVVDELQRSGAWDDTLFVFASDNGYNLGAHALLHKMAPYEESIRVPLAITGGKNLELRSGVHEGRWAMNIDLTATLVDYAKAQPKQALDGVSLRPLLSGASSSSSPWRTALPLEYVGGYAIGTDVPETYEDGSSGLALDLPSYRGVRASLSIGGEAHDWKYVAWFADDDFTPLTDEEVYDLTTDPWELDNLLATDPNRAQAALPQLQEHLRLLSSCVGKGCFR